MFFLFVFYCLFFIIFVVLFLLLTLLLKQYINLQALQSITIICPWQPSIIMIQSLQLKLFSKCITGWTNYNSTNKGNKITKLRNHCFIFIASNETTVSILSPSKRNQDTTVELHVTYILRME